MALIDIPGLEAIEVLRKEGYDIRTDVPEKDRPLEILLLNLMPLKEQTERHLLRRLAAADTLVRVTLLQTESYKGTHVSEEHLAQFYRTLSEVQEQFYDGLIITGAPVEFMAFEEVAYWPELCDLIKWSGAHVRSTLYICWGAQAGLYYHYGISKQVMPDKQFGIFEHRICHACDLTTDMEDPFGAPHSRHTYTPKDEVLATAELTLVAESPVAGVYLMLDEAKRLVFVTGHSEYEADTLKQEYERDLGKGLPIKMPQHYFPDDDAAKEPVSTWSRHSEQLFANWLKFYAAPGEA